MLWACLVEELAMCASLRSTHRRSADRCGPSGREPRASRHSGASNPQHKFACPRLAGGFAGLWILALRVLRLGRLRGVSRGNVNGWADVVAICGADNGWPHVRASRLGGLIQHLSVHKRRREVEPAVASSSASSTPRQALAPRPTRVCHRRRGQRQEIGRRTNDHTVRRWRPVHCQSTCPPVFAEY